MIIVKRTAKKKHAVYLQNYTHASRKLFLPYAIRKKRSLKKEVINASVDRLAHLIKSLHFNAKQNLLALLSRRY